MVSDFQPRESYEFFLQEIPDLLQRLEKGLLELRQESSLSKIHDLMRTTHSIKGGAACVGMKHIQNLAHSLETILKAIERQKTVIDLELEELLLQAYDCLSSPLLEEIKTGTCDQNRALEKAIGIFAQLEEKLTPQLSSTPTVDITEFLFAQEVTQGLERLETILTSSDAPEALEAIKAQIEIFRGIGELSHLPGFVAIAKMALKALQTHPQSAHHIGQIALNDFRAAHGAILAGNRDVGGEPSEALINFAQYTDLPSVSSSPPALSVRMDLERLELLHNLIGELATQDNRFFLHYQQHEEILSTLTYWFDRYRQLTQNLHRWTNKLLINQQIDKTELSFPSLDRDKLQTSVQAVVEEIAQLEEIIQDLSLLDRRFQQMLKHRQKTMKQVQRNLLKARMLPAGQLLNQFTRMVRDLAIKQDRQVILQLNGHKTLVDKAILDKLYDPLVHLIRNAIDHGIESPSERTAQRKTLQGTITVSIYHRGNQTLVEVQDDGRGIDIDTVRNRIIACEWLTLEEVSTLSKENLYDYLFAAGFSTSVQVSKLSGHGMGLSSVKMQVQALKGTITVTSQKGKGTTFTLRLPLTLTIVKLLVFRINVYLLAIPVDTLLSITVVDRLQIQATGSKEFYLWQGLAIPLYPHSLLTTYNYPIASHMAQSLPQQDWNISQKVTLLLLSHKDRVIALKIDQIILEQDLVIKPFNEVIPTPSCLSGCTILGDGRLVPVLNSSALVEKWLQYNQLDISFSVTTSPFKLTQTLIQVVDDSLTIRQTLSTTLQKAGYQVIEARDGWEAFGQIQQNLNIKAVICDIEMPRLNGIEFLSRCRQLRGEAFPVIILTSRQSKKSRQLAMQLGVSVYLTKPYADRELLDILQSLLDSE